MAGEVKLTPKMIERLKSLRDDGPSPRQPHTKVGYLLMQADLIEWCYLGIQDGLPITREEAVERWGSSWYLTEVKIDSNKERITEAGRAALAALEGEEKA